ncbi:MAG: class I tRNA ligase family protein, partial [Burkholderiales bacterium]|nr:class I tRNA ligase family protein [Burkholderiales bacterium]
KDRLYTTAADSHSRRSAQTALYHITRALALLLAPVLSFTADEVWNTLNGNEDDNVLLHTWHTLPTPADAAKLADDWARIRDFVAETKKQLEVVRESGGIGSSLQATLAITADATLHPLLAALGDDLKFVLIVSDVALAMGDTTSITVTPSAAAKCERCWHYRADVGTHAEHSTLCGRCVSNLFGNGEVRQHA